MSHPRIVSLISSATEIVHALGQGHVQVARSHECDWPPAVAALPQLTRPKFLVHGATSGEIDRSVRALVEQGLAVYEVDAERLREIAPDVILTQDQCEVCAVSLADVEQAVCAWAGPATRIVSLKPHTMADVFDDVRTVAGAIGVVDAGERLVASMQQRLERVARVVEGRPIARLAYIEWIDPPMSCGHWMPELVTAAGGESLFGETGKNSPRITWEEVARADPDVVLVAPCGYDIKTTLAEMDALRVNPLWMGLRAVVEGRVFVADGNAYFNRPGPRLVESAEILAEIMHPDRCDFGHEGVGYVGWK